MYETKPLATASCASLELGELSLKSDAWLWRQPIKAEHSQYHRYQ